MKTFSILTLGCKVNQYESQQTRELLERFGLRRINTSDNPDLVVVNTCCVTGTASAKSRQQIAKAIRCPNRPPVVVCGCLTAVETGRPGPDGDNVHRVRSRQDLVGKLTSLLDAPATAPRTQTHGTEPDTSIRPKNDLKVKNHIDLDENPGWRPLTSFQGHTRAFLKVQDGCDGYCTYCIIPKARPKVRSKPLPVARDEAAALVAAGHKEIVLTGVHLGSYGRDSTRRARWPRGENPQFAGLLSEIAQTPGLLRLRLSSIEPTDVTPALMEVMTDHPNIMPHLHLSLQSGSDNVLKTMARQYRTDDFLRCVELVERSLDRPAITADIIIGFPGETDSDFERTVNLVKQVKFAKMHVFAFSARGGTAAAAMRPKVSSGVVKERSRILRDLDVELQRQFRDQFVGRTATVLIESVNGQPSGRAERYFTIHLENAPKLQINDAVTVRLIQNTDQALLAEPVVVR